LTPENPEHPENMHTLNREVSVPITQLPESGQVSEFCVQLPFDDETGLFGLLQEHEEEFYQELAKLNGAGFALGLDILPHDAILPSNESQLRYFTGTMNL